MLEALQVIKNPHSTDDEKDLAWEDFEMLIQQIDNASSTSSLPLFFVYQYTLVDILFTSFQ